MDYLVPAWHDLPVDSAVTTPQLHFDDALSNFHLLASAKRKAGLILVDFQPSLMTTLSTERIVPAKIYSVFDLLQGVNHFSSQTLTYDDLVWPANARFEFSPFHLNVYQDDQDYATVVFDENSRIIYVEYAPQEANRYRLVFDSRGFVSRKDIYDPQGSRIVQHIYYDEAGNWRFKHSLTDDSVELNPENDSITLSLTYPHLQDLLKEVLLRQIFPKLKQEDRLLVSLDDDSLIQPEFFLQYPRTMYYASSWNKTKWAYDRLNGQPGFHCVFDTPDLARQLSARQPVVISPFQTYFKLGHSQRQDRQRILLFVEDIPDINVLAQLSELIFQYLMKAKGDVELYLLSYSRGGFDRSQQIIQFLQNSHSDEFQLIDPDNDDAKEELVDTKEEKVQLVIKAEQCTANTDVLTVLDKTRLVIDWGTKPDNYLRTACVSVGIPRIQRVETPEVKDHQNGLVITDQGELPAALDYYLASLQNWNLSLTYNVKVLNAHSGRHIIEKWDRAWEKYHLGVNGK